MRGHVKNLKSLHITGNIFLEEIDIDEITSAVKGDILLYPVVERSVVDLSQFYYKKGCRGYFKAKIYDGYNWCHIDMLDLFDDKQNYFSKTEIPIYTFKLCKSVIEDMKDMELFKTYREHYTKDMPERHGFKGRKDSINKSK
jgi:hypothetical protein